MTATATIECMGHPVNTGRLCQETYESASRFAGRRARELRKLGYRVVTSGMGPQVTRFGIITLTLVSIFQGIHEDTFGIPPVNRIQ